MLYIELVVDRKTVLEDIKRILRLFISFASFSSLNHDVGDSVSDRRCSCLISLTHPLSQLHVRLLCQVLLSWGSCSLRLCWCLIGTTFCSIGCLWRRISFLTESLGDDEETEVNSVLE